VAKPRVCSVVIRSWCGWPPDLQQAGHTAVL